jgi:hypothetical protein
MQINEIQVKEKLAADKYWMESSRVDALGVNGTAL